MSQDRFFQRLATFGYDETIRFVVPHYDLVHEALVGVLRSQMQQRNSFHQPYVVLDVGSGTGNEAGRILAELENLVIVAVDINSEMHQRLKSRLSALGIADIKSRLITVTADITSKETIEVLRDALKAFGRIDFDVVTSAFTIHNLTPLDKKAALKTCHSVLEPRGFLLNCDLYSFQDLRLSRAAHLYDIEFINHHFATALGTTPLQQDQNKHLTKLWQEWLRHYEHENYLEPIESYGSRRGQADLLQEIGFVNPTIVYRFFQTAMLCAWKAG